MRTTRRPHGNYYAEAIATRGDKRFGVQVARQAPTLASACRALDAHNATGGHITYWYEREQRRGLIAERDATGQWLALNPYNGERIPFDPYTPQAEAS